MINGVKFLSNEALNVRRNSQIIKKTFMVIFYFQGGAILLHSTNMRITIENAFFIKNKAEGVSEFIWWYAD